MSCYGILLYKKPGARINYRMNENQFFCGIDLVTPLALIVNEVINLLYSYAFSDGPGELNIELEPDTAMDSDGNTAYTIRVCDTGPGITESTKEVLEKQPGVILIRNLCSQIGGSYNYIPATTGNYNIILSISLSKDQAA